MTLVGALRTAPDKLRADLQRFYGLNLDDLGPIRPRRMADLAANLPADAAIWTAFDRRAAWTPTQYLLAEIADNTNFLAFTKTKEGHRKGARWKGRIQRPGQPTAKKQETALPADQMLAMLSKPRG